MRWQWAVLRRWFLPDPPLHVALFPHLPPDQRECPKCKRTVTHWMTYADGRILCAVCDQEPAPPMRAVKAGR